MFEFSVFFVFAIFFILAAVTWFFNISARSNALDPAAAALISFGGHHSEMLLRIKKAENGMVPHNTLSSEECYVCEELAEIGLLVDLPGSWILSGEGEIFLKRSRRIDRPLQRSANYSEDFNAL